MWGIWRYSPPLIAYGSVCNNDTDCGSLWYCAEITGSKTCDVNKYGFILYSFCKLLCLQYSQAPDIPPMVLSSGLGDVVANSTYLK